MTVLYFEAPEGSERAAEFRLRDDGVVDVRILKHDEAVDDLTRGVSSRSLHRLVLLNEGQLFIDALKESLQNTTYWFAQDEADTPASSKPVS